MLRVSPSNGAISTRSDLAGKITKFDENASTRFNKSSGSVNALSQPLPTHYSSSIDIVSADDDDEDEDDLGSWDEHQFGILRRSVSLYTSNYPEPAKSDSLNIPRDKQSPQVLPAARSDATDSKMNIQDRPTVKPNMTTSFTLNDVVGVIDLSVTGETIEVSDDELNFTSGSLPSPSFIGGDQIQRSAAVCFDRHAKLIEAGVKKELDEEGTDGRTNRPTTCSDDCSVSPGGDTKSDAVQEVASVVLLNSSQQALSPLSSFEYSLHAPQPLTIFSDEYFSSPINSAMIAKNDNLRSSSPLSYGAINRSTPSLTADLSSSFFSSPSLVDLANTDVPVIVMNSQFHSSPFIPSPGNGTHAYKVELVQPIPLPPPTVSTVQDSDSERELEVEADAEFGGNISFGQSGHVLSPYPVPRSLPINRSFASLPYPKNPESSIDSIFGAPNSNDKTIPPIGDADLRMRWMARTVPRAPRWSKRRKMTFGDSDVDSPTARKHGVKENELVDLELDFSNWQRKFKQDAKDKKSSFNGKTDSASHQSRPVTDCPVQSVISPTSPCTSSYPSTRRNTLHLRMASDSSASPTCSSSPLAQVHLAKERRSVLIKPFLKESLSISPSKRNNPSEIAETKRMRDEEEMEEREEQVLVDKCSPPPPPSQSSTPTPCTPSLLALDSSSPASCLSRTLSKARSFTSHAVTSQSGNNPVDLQTEDKTSEDEDMLFMERPFTCVYTRSISPDTSWMKQRQLSVDVPDDEDPLACVDVW